MPSPFDLWKLIRERKTIVPNFVEISSAQQFPPLSQEPIVPQKHYFAIQVDEIFLANNRQWHKELDPVVLAITEFAYGGKQITLPFVIGPKLFGDKVTMIPQGMLYRRTKVAGIHPFRGGCIVSTVVLCQVPRHDYARQLLKLVESAANTIPFAANLTTYTKFADLLIDGIEAMLGVGEARPLVGVRQEFNHDLGTSIKHAYFVLVDGPEEQFPSRNFWVRDGSLLIGHSEDKLQPFRDANYVLFSTHGVAEIGDLSMLPQHETEKMIIQFAASPEEATWKRAKAELVVLLRELLASPDLTQEQALRYHENIVLEAQQVHKRALTIGTLGAIPKVIEQDELQKSVALLDL